jgi:hypothetical protein
VHPKRPVNVNGKIRTKSVNGSLLCLNSECPTYKFGVSVNTRNRDVEASKCIVLTGMTTILYSQRLPAFSPHDNSQYQTVFKPNSMPRVRSAQPVPVSTGAHAEKDLGVSIYI